MIVNSFLHYFCFSLILFLNYITVSNAAGGTTAASGGALSILDIKDFERERKREEETEAMVTLGMVGIMGVIMIVGSGIWGYKRCCRQKKVGLEEAKAGDRTKTFQEAKLKCKLGNKQKL